MPEISIETTSPKRHAWRVILISLGITGIWVSINKIKEIKVWVASNEIGQWIFFLVSIGLFLGSIVLLIYSVSLIPIILSDVNWSAIRITRIALFGERVVINLKTKTEIDVPE